jgi:hypothetical protein
MPDLDVPDHEQTRTGRLVSDLAAAVTHLQFRVSKLEGPARQPSADKDLEITALRERVRVVEVQRDGLQTVVEELRERLRQILRIAQ